MFLSSWVLLGVRMRRCLVNVNERLFLRCCSFRVLLRIAVLRLKLFRLRLSLRG